MRCFSAALGVALLAVAAAPAHARASHGGGGGHGHGHGHGHGFTHAWGHTSGGGSWWGGAPMVTPLELSAGLGAASVDLAPLGLQRSTLFSGEARLFWMPLRHVAFGARVAGLGGDRVAGFAIGPSLATVWNWGPVELRAELSAGARQLTATLDSSCGCAGLRVSATAAYVEPRALVGVALGPIVIGAYAGADVLPGGGLVAGGTVALRDGAWREHAGLAH